ncbi:MAG: hypothetical protein QOE61_6786 [Micromonosporaceae bacterium]|jgi:hypothetical protein|nr:hypothetical protein [Micromonosporaceae bacterium]
MNGQILRGWTQLMGFHLCHADIQTNSSKYLADAVMKFASEALLFNILGAPRFLPSHVFIRSSL